MSIVKLNDRAVSNATTFGSISSLGEMKFISKATASASASIEFTSGIDSTYKEYVFYFVNIHPSTDITTFRFQTSTNGGTSYGVTATTTAISPYHAESDAFAGVGNATSWDLAQSTSFQNLSVDIGNQSDECETGYLHWFNPSRTYVKHFISTNQWYKQDNVSYGTHVAGYFNTTSSIDAVKFEISSGTIDAGEILLFGIN